MEVRNKKVVSAATIINGGDLLISDSLLAYSRREDDTYDFSGIFKYVSEYIKAADYAVINLETCMGKPGDYCGFPRFRSPDSIIEAAKNAGFKMFLTASNHSYDWGEEGIVHKLECLDQYGVDYVGTRRSAEEPLHKVIEVNGIRIGMLNYTKVSRASRRFRMIMNVAVNRKTGKKEKIIVNRKGQQLIALFRENRTKYFAEQLRQDIAALRAQGAEIIAAYPHWGTEYQIESDGWQEANAQIMCDAGVDVIVGSHPHVVQPVKVYTSDVSGKTTVCLHSMGNFVSSMNASHEKENAEYTEDGALFEYTVEKYEDGSAAVVRAEVLPIWVRRNRQEREFTVIPLEKDVDWKEKYGTVNYSTRPSSAFQSRQRTRKLVSKGLKAFNSIYNAES